MHFDRLDALPAYNYIGSESGQIRTFINAIFPQLTRSCTSLMVRRREATLRSNSAFEAEAREQGLDVREVVDVAFAGMVARIIDKGKAETTRTSCVTQRMIILDQRAVVVDGPQLGAEQLAWFVTDPDIVRWAQQMFTAAGSWAMRCPPP
ncbi:MAG: hypothetical protein WKF76_01320 [Nocardioidaceae bacterium]